MEWTNPNGKEEEIKSEFGSSIPVRFFTESNQEELEDGFTVIMHTHEGNNAETQWNSVEGCLPQVGQEVLIANKSRIKIGWLAELPKGKFVEWHTCDGTLCKITHWMPLPDLPRGEA